MVRRPGFSLFVAPGSHWLLQRPLGCGRVGGMDDRKIERVNIAPEEGWRRSPVGFLPDLGDMENRLRDAGVTSWDMHERHLSVKIFVDADAHGLSAARAAWLSIAAVCDMAGDEEYQDIAAFSPHSVARISRLPPTL